MRRPAPTARKVSFVGVEVTEPTPRLEAGPRIVTGLSARSCVIAFGFRRPYSPSSGTRASPAGPCANSPILAAACLRTTMRSFASPRSSRFTYGSLLHWRCRSTGSRHWRHNVFGPQGAYWAVHSTGSGTADSLHSQPTVFHQVSIVLSDPRILLSARHNCAIHADVRDIRVGTRFRSRQSQCPYRTYRLILTHVP